MSSFTIHVKLFVFLMIFVCYLGCMNSSDMKIRGETEMGYRVRQINESTVALVHFDIASHRTNVYCTGVWVSERVILTANHCITGLTGMVNHERIMEDLDPVESKDMVVHYIVNSEEMGIGETPAGEHTARVLTLGDNYGLDLALLEVNKGYPLHKIAELAETSPEVGSRLSIVGHVKGLYWSYIEGMVGGYRKDLKKVGKETGGPFMQVNGPVYFGNSGGGAFDKDGKLVGICSFLSGVPSISFFIHLDSIRGLLAGQHLIKLKLNVSIGDPDLN